MTPKGSHAKDIELMLIDSKRRLNEAADRGNFPEMTRLADQITSLGRLLGHAS